MKSAASTEPCYPAWACLLMPCGSLQPVTTGEDNPWGMRNYIGNAREWVQDGGSLEARGGAFTDSRDNCVVETSVRRNPKKMA